MKGVLKIIGMTLATGVALVIAVKYPSLLSALGLAAWAVGTVYAGCLEIRKNR